MSLSLNRIYDNIGIALDSYANAMTKLQEQAATGCQVNRASDDPSAAYKILGISSDASSLENYQESISGTTSALELSSTVIQNIVSSMSELRTRITQVTSAVYDDESRRRTAEGINDILEQIVQLANTQYSGQYLFSGSNMSAVPYVIERTDGEITKVNYQGGADNRSLELAPGVSSDIFLAGENVFRSDDRQEPIFAGVTGAKAGTGTSSVQGTVWLTVINDGANYQISIDDGATYVTVPAGGEANQAVIDSRTGRVLYIDTTELNQTGVEMVRVPGTYDIFEALITLRDILNNERELPEDQLKTIREKSSEILDEVDDILVNQSVMTGSKIGFLDSLKDSLDSLTINNEDEKARLEDADISQVSIELSRIQVLYQMSLAVVGKLASMSLMDYIE